MRWPKEMTKYGDTPKSTHNKSTVFPNANTSALSVPRRSQRFQQPQEAAFLHSHARPAVSALLTLTVPRTTASSSSPPLSAPGRITQAHTRSRAAEDSVLQSLRPSCLSHSNLLHCLRPPQGRTHSRVSRPHAHGFSPHTLGFSVSYTHTPYTHHLAVFHTQSPSHSGSCTLTKPLTEGLSSLTHARARAPASSSHHRPLRDPRSRRPPLSRGVSPAPSAPRGFRPAPSTRPRRPRRAFGRTLDGPRAEPEPAPHLLRPASYLLVARSCQDARSRRRPAAQAPPTPRHSHRIATARAAWGPGSERGPQAALLPGTRARRGPRRSAYRYRAASSRPRPAAPCGP